MKLRNVGRRIATFFRHSPWEGTLLVILAVSLALFCKQLSALFQWVVLQKRERFLCVLCVLFVGVPAAQLLIGRTRAGAARLGGVTRIHGSINQWPQQFLGATETIFYSLAFAFADYKEVLMGIGAWVAFKSFGDWARIKSQGTERGLSDPDESRRRLYVFLFANALVVGAAGVLGWTIRFWALRVVE